MSTFWSWFVIALTVGTIIGCVWLLQAQSRMPAGSRREDTTGHVWDRDITEYNKPMPRWWLLLFWATALFAAAYLVVYPGLGNFAGIGAWDQIDQYERELAAAEERYADVYRAFESVPLAELSANAEAVKLGRNLFLNRCAGCHGSDARGARGFPNLTDGAWLHGNAPETVQASIANGRTGVMPALGAALGEPGVGEVIAFIRSLPAPAGTAPSAEATAGRQKFMTFCIACHGADARGNPAIGAPNLADGDWLHGPNDADIRDVIMKGRMNQMPAQQEALGADRIRVLVAYVLSLGHEAGG